MGNLTLIFLFCVFAFARGMYQEDEDAIREVVAENADLMQRAKDEDLIREAAIDFSIESVEELLNDAGSSDDSKSGEKKILSKFKKEINFKVYDRHAVDNPYRLKFDSVMGADYINKKWKTIIFIHGWRSTDVFVEKLKKAYWAGNDNNINAIEVDWKKGANSLIYFPCAKRVPNLGESVAKFIKLNRKHIDLDKLIIVGHSLGAHAAGYAGRILQLKYNLMVQQIVGLDAAGLGFRGHNNKNKLQPSDAQSVLVIHTTNTFGLLEPLGTLDIYVNGGKKQPNCSIPDSHRFAKRFYEHLFIETAPIFGRPYSSFDDVKAGKIPQTEEIELFRDDTFLPNGTLIYVNTKTLTNFIHPNSEPSCSVCKIL